MLDETLEGKERGNAAYKKRDFAALHDHYDEAIRLSPREITFYSNKGAAFLEEGKYEDCIATCLKAVDIGLEIKAQTAKAMARTGTAYAKLGNASEALVWYEKSLAEVHNEDVAKKAAEMTEILQNKTVKDDDSKNGSGKDSPASAPSQKPLSSIYAYGILPSLLFLPDTEKNAQRCKNAVYSSPEITDSFHEFMSDYAVITSGNDLTMVIKFTNIKTTKTWNHFSWITPFIRFYSMIELFPDNAYFVMENACFIDRFEYTAPELPSRAILSFVRSRMPHLVWLAGPSSFFRGIRVRSNKQFYYVRIIFSENIMNDFLSIFSGQRFAAKKIEISHHNIDDDSLNLRDVMNFFENSNLRMPETRYVHIMLQVDDNFVPISRFLEALRSFFPWVKKIDIYTLFRPSNYNYGNLEDAYQHCRRELAMLPEGLKVYFSLAHHVVYPDNEPDDFMRKHESRHFAFFATWKSPVFPPCVRSFAYANCDRNIGKNAILNYELQFPLDG